MTKRTLAEAVNQALRQEMARDERVIILGEDVGRFGGAFHVTHGLLEEFGPERVCDTPISEAGFMGMGIGAALTGLRPIVEFQYADFIFCAMDQIVNQAAKIRLMSGGKASVPLVIRAPQGATGRGAQHSQSVEAWFMHTPGMKVVVPSTPYDAKGLLISAIRDNNPVLFLEHKTLYGSASPGGGKAPSDSSLSDLGSDVPEEAYTIPLGKADIKRPGKHVTLIATLLMVHRALAAARSLAEEGIEVEVIDPRTLVPLDTETILASIRKTHRAVVVSEDVTRAGVSAELTALIATEAFDDLDAPVERVAALDTPIPFAPRAEARVIPQEETIRRAIRKVLSNLRRPACGDEYSAAHPGQIDFRSGPAALAQTGRRSGPARRGGGRARDGQVHPGAGIPSQRGLARDPGRSRSAGNHRPAPGCGGRSRRSAPAARPASPVAVTPRAKLLRKQPRCRLACRPPRAPTGASPRPPANWPRSSASTSPR